MAYTSDSIENIIKSLTIGGKTYPLGVQYADKADSMNVTAAVGSTKRPIYLKADGTFAQTSYTLNKSVPSTAVFTDTTYQLTLNGTTNGTGTTNLGTIYAPTSAGTNGQYLMSNGSGAPIWADFSTLLSPFLTEENLEAYGNWINIFADSSNNYAGFKVLNESGSTTMHSDGIYLTHYGDSANIVFTFNTLQFTASDTEFDTSNTVFNGNLHIGSELHLDDYANITIKAEVDDSDPHNSKKSVIIDSDLEIGSALYLSDNQTDYASIYTDGEGDLFFSGTNFEFPQSGNFVVNGPVSLKGAKNTGSATNPIYIDTNGQFQPTIHTLAKSVPSNAKFTDTTYKLTLNGTTNGSGSTNLGTIYAPTSAGTNGQYLMSNGSGAPTWVNLPDINNLVNQISQLQSRISYLESII